MSFHVGPFILAVICSAWLAIPRAHSAEYGPEERAHWSLQPRSVPVPPQCSDPREQSWIRTPVDAFVINGLRRAGLSPAEPATSAVLLRRLYLHLTGLPPTPEQVEEFLADNTQHAYEGLVDRLLASPHLGEHFGQYWLDVVRFAESEGFEYDRHRPGAWRYRDYVVSSFNGDKPFDRFLTEQLSGDELDSPTEESLVACGFHRLGPVRRNAGNSDVAFSRNEVLTEMTDSIGSVFLGLTVGCARCHDHMFDPIRQRDYYHLQAFMAAVQDHDIQLGSAIEIGEWNRVNSAVQDEIKQIREALNATDVKNRDELTARLKAAEQRVPKPLPTISSVRDDAVQRTSIYVLERGMTDRRGELVGPKFLGVLLGENSPEIAANIERPRLALARWLTAPDHPLTARVIVNRVWQFHFGRGIVPTPNDFGVNGIQPSHPELLDFLANELIAHGWQIKPIHRLILTSATYRQASRSGDFDRAEGIDPDNQWLWQFPRRRLTAEQLRDSMLAVSGRINLRIGGPSVIPPVEQELIDLLYAPEQWEVTADTREHDRRSIYMIAKRNLRLPYLEVFDQPDLQTSCSRRESSTHAPQALELLNGRLANELASAFAGRLRDDVGNNPEQQVIRGFQAAVSRAPSRAELDVSLCFLETERLSEFALALLNLNSFLYVD